MRQLHLEYHDVSPVQSVIYQKSHNQIILEMQNNIVIFGGSGSRQLANNISTELNLPLGLGQLIRFSEGTIYVQIDEEIHGKDVYVVQSTANPVNDNFMELLFMLDACKRANAKTITAIVPYFSYAKGDKMDGLHVSVRARVCADAIEGAGADQIIFLDLHTQQIQGFFNIPVDNLHALPVLIKALMERKLKDPVIVSPDVGFIKQARIFSKLLGCPLAIVDKERIDHDENPIALNILGEVKGKTAIIVDDFIASGGTLCNAADKLISYGAKSVCAAITHGLFTKNAVEKIDNSQINEVIVTDSVEVNRIQSCKKIQIVSVARIFSEAIKMNHNF